MYKAEVTRLKFSYDIGSKKVITEEPGILIRGDRQNIFIYLSDFGLRVERIKDLSSLIDGLEVDSITEEYIFASGVKERLQFDKIIDMKFIDYCHYLAELEQEQFETYSKEVI